MEHGNSGDSNNSRSARNCLQGHKKDRKHRKNRDHIDHSIRLNILKCPRYLRILALAQIPVKKHQLMLVRKTLKEWNNDISLSSNHRVKLKEEEKLEKSINLAREQKKLWNVRVTVIPIVNRGRGAVLKQFKRDFKKTRDWRKNRNRAKHKIIKIAVDT